MTGNGAYQPSIVAQLRYTVQWFQEWSEMQRGDFLPILTQKLAPTNYVNGIVSGMDSLGCNEGGPASLFQIRVKLFRNWVDTWSQAERDQLLNHIKNMDPGFYARLQEELQSCNGEVPRREESPCDEPAQSPDHEAVHQDADVAQDDAAVGVPEALPDVVAPNPTSNSVIEDDDDENVDDDPDSLVESEGVKQEMGELIEAAEHSE